MDDPPQGQEREDGEIVVTPAMIDAGLNELYGRSFGDDLRDTLEAVFRTMAYESTQFRPAIFQSR